MKWLLHDNIRRLMQANRFWALGISKGFGRSAVRVLDMVEWGRGRREGRRSWRGGTERSEVGSRRWRTRNERQKKTEQRSGLGLRYAWGRSRLD